MSVDIKNKLRELKYFREKPWLIDDYVNAYKKIPDGILDNDFIKKITDDITESRLSEISISHFISNLNCGNLSGKSNGPDLVLKTPTRIWNIEIVTPIKVESTKGKFLIIDSNNGSQHDEIKEIVNTMTLKTRVSSVYLDKLKQYKKWSSEGIITKDDINLILINLGFVQHLMTGDMRNLWKVFFDQSHLFVGESCEDSISASVVEFPSRVNKNNGASFEQSYFSHPSPGTELISSVLLFNLKSPTPPQLFEPGVRFDNPNATNPVRGDLTELMMYFSKEEDPSRYFLDQIKANCGCLHL